MREDRGVWSDDAIAGLATHEEQETATGDHADPNSVNRNLRTLDGVDQSEAICCASARRIDHEGQLLRACIALDQVLFQDETNSFFAASRAEFFHEQVNATFV